MKGFLRNLEATEKMIFIGILLATLCIGFSCSFKDLCYKSNILELFCFSQELTRSLISILHVNSCLLMLHRKDVISEVLSFD